MRESRHLGNLVRIHLVAVAVWILVAAPSHVSAQGDITGDWEIKMDRNGRVSYASLSISKKADGTLTGTWGRNELSDVKFEGQKLTFTRTVRMGETEFKLSYEGTLEGGNLVGTLSSERGSFAAVGSRPKPKCPVLGSWTMKYTIRDRAMTSTLSVCEGPGGALEAKWASGTGEHVVSNVKFQEGRLTFDRKSKIGEREFESSFEGTVKGNDLTGTMKSQMGEIPVTGQRVGADLVGKWELTTATDQGPRTSTLTVYGDLTGRYELFGGEIPVQDLKIDGDQVSFSVEMGFGAQPFKIDFKGKLEGKTLKGEVTSPMGTREVTGKKADGASAVVGTWEITRESTRPGAGGPRTATLTIKDDMTGTYTMRETTVPLTDLRVDGDQLSFKVTVKYGEREVTLEFKGKVEGTVLEGQFTSPRGTREATGKKVTPTTL